MMSLIISIHTVKNTSTVQIKAGTRYSACSRQINGGFPLKALIIALLKLLKNTRRHPELVSGSSVISAHEARPKSQYKNHGGAV